MPTIDDLPPATAAADTDEVPTSQNGIARKVTRAQFLSGVQAAFALPSLSLVGRASSGTGGAETIAVGKHLSLANGVLAADAGAFVIAQLPNGSVPAPADPVALSQSATNVQVPFATFAAGLSGLSGLDASRFLVTTTGSTAGVKLADALANVLPRTGGQLTGPLLLQADPALATQAATKRYVDAASATKVARGGDQMAGPLTFQNPATGATASLAAGALSVFDYGVAASAPGVSINTAGSLSAQTWPGGLYSQFEVIHSGGTPGYVVPNGKFALSIANPANADGSLADGPATNHWAMHALTYSFATQSAHANDGGAAGSQHGAILGQFVREPPTGGFPAGKVGAAGWAMSLEARDFTGKPSSVGGAFTAIEIDMSAAGPDDGNQRFGIQFNIGADPAPRGTGYCEFGRFLYVNAFNQPGNQCWFRSQLELFAPYTVAAIDLSQGTQDIANPLTGAANGAVAIKLRAGQKYGLNGDGITGQFITYNAKLARTELWSGGTLRAAFPDAGGIVLPGLPKAAAGLASGALWNNGGVVNVVG